MPELSQSTIESAVSRFNDYLNKSSFKSARLEGHFDAAANSDNFIVYARDHRAAKEILNTAENLRKSLSNEWFGHEKKIWHQPLVIGAIVDESKSCSGETRFSKNSNSSPTFSGCIVSGSKERILDSVLPHELTHALFATHFKTYVPRWADEGASATTESIHEKNKYDKGLIYYLNESRGIPLNALFTSKEYPDDLQVFYAQGYSVSKYLINLGDSIEELERDSRKITGKQRFIEFLEKGMETNDWPSAVNEFYGFNSISDLQQQWNKILADSVHQNDYVGNDSFGKNNLPEGLRKKLGNNILQYKKETTIPPQVIDPQSILKVTELYEELVLPKAP